MTATSASDGQARAIATASAVLHADYGYNKGSVLFKPTLTSCLTVSLPLMQSASAADLLEPTFTKGNLS